MVSVGRVGRPHGIRGAFVVEHPSEEPRRFQVGATLHGPHGPVTVVDSMRSGGRLVVRVEPPVERGAELKVRRDALEAPGEGEYYVFELVGLEVEEETGRALGRVRNVVPAPANDVLELDSGLALPLVESCVRAVDRDAGRILVAEGFADPD